jgi:hypothetical protein
MTYIHMGDLPMDMDRAEALRCLRIHDASLSDTTRRMRSALGIEPDVVHFQGHRFTWEEVWPKKYYRICGECFEVWTKHTLRKAYRREVWRILKNPLPAPFETPRPTLWSDIRALWKAYTIRAKNIFFCQECIHDF